MKKLMLAAIIAVFGLASPAYAVSFTLNDYTVSNFVESAGNLGLDTEVEDVFVNGGSIDLNFVGATQEVDLFRIWTDESAKFQADDVVQKPISVNFQFTPSTTGPDVTGDTGGALFFPANPLASALCLANLGCGYAVWDAPVVLNFGTTGQLQVALSNVLFGDLNDAILNKGTVKATFTLLAEDTVPAPEPGTLVLFGVGLALTGGQIRRRMKKN